MTQGHNAEVDLWALGVLVYELLCGRYDFTETVAQYCCNSYSQPPKRKSGFKIIVLITIGHRTPFIARDAMDTYNLILLGINKLQLDSSLDGDARDLVFCLCRCVKVL